MLEITEQEKHLGILFSGTANPSIAREIVQYLGVDLGSAKIERFPDGEISVQIDDNVRGRDVFVVQSLAHDPNEHLMELLIMIDAFKRASAREIAVVVPYFAYSRQDRKDKARVPITAKLVANMLQEAGASRILTMDLHAGQLQGFFDIPVDNLYGRPLLVKAVRALGLEDLVIAAPDVGSSKLVRDFSRDLGVDFAIVDKCRLNSSDVEVTTVIGEVEGKDVLLADDMCSTAGTLVSAAKACREKGAKRIFAAVTHGLFVGQAIERINESPIEKVLYSNTVPATETVASNPKFQQVSVASLFGEAIRRIVSAESISSLFKVAAK